MDEQEQRTDDARWVRVDFDTFGTMTGMELHNVGPAQLYAVAGYAELQANMMAAAATQTQSGNRIIAARSMPQ